jgi:hypothetical protein
LERLKNSDDWRELALLSLRKMVQGGIYLQDDIRLRKNLTLTPGVRYELQTHVRNNANVGPRIGMTWAPKLFGLLQAFGNSAMRRSYGGGARLLMSSAVELLFPVLLAPVVATSQTVFMGGLLLGRRLKWRAQKRADRSIATEEALRRLWPQALLGLAFLAGFVTLLPAAIWWASPMIAGVLLAVPFTVITANPRFGAFLASARLCATPEEFQPTPEVRAVCPWLVAASPSPSYGGGDKLPDRAAPQPEATAAS